MEGILQGSALCESGYHCGLITGGDARGKTALGARLPINGIAGGLGELMQ